MENYQLKWSGNNIDTFSYMMQTNIELMIDWVEKEFQFYQLTMQI
jgi:hypothetical protein